MAAIKKGIAIEITVGGTSKVLIKAGMPKTTNPLNILEPKIFPRAISFLPFLAAEIERLKVFSASLEKKQAGNPPLFQ